MRFSKLATVASAVILALLVFSASIAVPILFWSFYYIQIDALRLPERTERPGEAIREACDEVLDFCVLGTPSGTGEPPWLESGRSCFAGVRTLSRADFLVLGVMVVSTALLLLLRWLHRLGSYRPASREPGFWAGVLAAGLVLAVGAPAALDFSRVFTVFHAVFFPGKDNWLSNPATDEIILIMSERSFPNCALPVGVILLSACGALITGDLLSARRRTKKTVLPR